MKTLAEWCEIRRDAVDTQFFPVYFEVIMTDVKLSIREFNASEILEISGPFEKRELRNIYVPVR